MPEPPLTSTHSFQTLSAFRTPYLSMPFTVTRWNPSKESCSLYAWDKLSRGTVFNRTVHNKFVLTCTRLICQHHTCVHSYSTIIRQRSCMYWKKKKIKNSRLAPLMGQMTPSLIEHVLIVSFLLWMFLFILYALLLMFTSIYSKFTNIDFVILIKYAFS